MASENNLLNRLTTLVRGFDDASWEALSSAGLLRRARKDIEKGLEIKVGNETSDALTIEVPPFLVSLTVSGPAGARCSCPSPGVCQHIVAAGLFLQGRSGPSEGVSVSAQQARTPAVPVDEIVLLTTERLKAWAGATDYKNGVVLFEKNSLPPIIEYADSVLVRLLPSGIEVRFVPGGGLDGMILPKSLGKRAAVAAVLALRKHLGLAVPIAAAQHSLVELGGTPRTKKEILDSACSLLEDAVSVGLTHVSEVFADRFVTLAVSSQGAHMPRVALALKTIADEVKSILLRQARADEARLLLVIARVYALMDAIRSGADDQTAELVGSHRGQYVEVPEIELSGVGAYTWQTGSGYVGLTVLFWSNSSQEFLSWAYARPEMQRVDARQRFYGEGPWEGTQSPQQVAASTIKLRNARRTANGRLSGSTKTNALVLSSVVPATLEFGDRLFTSWPLLRRYVAAKQPLGLRDPNPLELIAVLQPAEFGARSFDTIAQTFSWEVYDVINQPLVLTLPFREWTKESIEILEQLSPAANVSWRFVVRLTSQDGELLVEPISILRAENTEKPVFQLAFDSLPQQNGAARHTEAPGSDELIEEELENVEADLPARGSLTRVVTELNQRLEAIAETGIQNGLATHRDWFRRSQNEVHNFGLTVLARQIGSLATPVDLLRARYLSHLHTQAAAQLLV